MKYSVYENVVTFRLIPVVIGALGMVLGSLDEWLERIGVK